jgi:putative phosphoribosyl transferase
MRHPLPNLLSDRHAAGRLLAQRLEAYADIPHGIVLGLPRGGVPIAYEIAQHLHLPYDICLVRKLGLPRNPEIAMGAIGANGVRVLNYEVIAWEGATSHEIETVAAKELRELQRREHVYRGSRESPSLQNQVVILVDDGMATGSSMFAAVQVVQSQQPSAVIVAIPVAPRSTCEEVAAQVDQVVCLIQPEPFYAIGKWYENFTQVDDAEVCRLLTASQSVPPNPGPAVAVLV